MPIFSARCFLITAGCALLASSSPTLAGEPVPVGAEFQVNLATTNFQGNPKIAARADGSFIVVWESDAVDAGDIVLRIFDSSGSPIGGEIEVNSYTPGEQAARRHWVSAHPDGSFVVVWDSTDAAGGSEDTDVHARQFFSDGTPNGAQFQINTSTAYSQREPTVATTASGGFAVVWTSSVSTGTDIDGTSIQFGLWDGDGMAVGDETQINSYTTSDQDEPLIVRTSSDELLVIWASEISPATDNLGESVQAQRLQSDGTPIGDQFQVNSYIDDTQDTPNVAVAADGGFVVAWRSYGSYGNDTSETSTLAQQFSSDGTRIGDEIQVNSFTTGFNDDPSLVFDPYGGFLVVWESEPDDVGNPSPDGSGDAVRGQRFSSAGSPVGAEFAINSVTEGDQNDPAIAVIGPERAVIVFESSTSAGTDTSDDSVQARIIDICPGPNDGVDADNDSIPDDCDLCQGDNATGDEDSDGLCGDLDLCLGDNATGDVDGDGICADRDCNDNDPSNVCAVFADDFELGTTSSWSSQQGG